MITSIQRVCRILMFKPQLEINGQISRAMNMNFIQRSLHTVLGVNNSVLRKATFLATVETTWHQPSRGLKYVGKVHRRCKDCHLMLIDGIMHNFCKAHPRHKQKAKTKKPKNTWILTGVTTHPHGKKITDWVDRN